MYKQCNHSILDGNEYDETLANSIKQSTQEGRGEKKEPRERTQV